MGGRGSSGGPPRPNGDGPDRCDLRFRTNLYSPIASVVDALSVGDRLDILLITQGEFQSVAALTKSTGDVAGTIAGAPQLGVLIACLAQYNYDAEVTAISGSRVTVIVERV